MDEQDKQERFEAVVMPHLDAAYNLARWLTHNEHDAQDVVQDAFLRAYKFFEGFRGANSRSWILSIVRNTCYSWLQRNRKSDLVTNLDETLHELEDTACPPDVLLLKGDDRDRVRHALEQLPAEFREAMILRELEELSYKEIAAITEVPIGTVMSRLARARKQIEQSLVGGLAHGGAQ